MRYLLSLLILFLIFACNDKIDEEPIDKTLPACVEKLIESDSGIYRNVIVVHIQQVDGELHYWMNTDARHADGVELIVNNECQVVCTLCGECEPAGCVEDYGDWEVIWER